MLITTPLKTLLLTLPLTLAIPYPYPFTTTNTTTLPVHPRAEAGQAANLHISIYKDYECGGAGIPDNEGTLVNWNAQTPTPYTGKSYMLSRELAPNEMLDFSKRGGESACAVFVGKVVGERRRAETCYNWDEDFDCMHLWKVGRV